MESRDVIPAGLALTALALVVVGIHQELLTTRFAGGPIIETGWGGDLSYQERQLGALVAGALPVAAASARYRRAGYLVQAVGAVVLGATLLATTHWIGQPEVYTGLPVAGGASGVFVLGAEPYLLVVGGLLLVGAGVAGARPDATDAADNDSQGPAGVTR